MPPTRGRGRQPRNATDEADHPHDQVGPSNSNPLPPPPPSNGTGTGRHTSRAETARRTAAIPAVSASAQGVLTRSARLRATHAVPSSTRGRGRVGARGRQSTPFRFSTNEEAEEPERMDESARDLTAEAANEIALNRVFQRALTRAEERRNARQASRQLEPLPGPQLQPMPMDEATPGQPQPHDDVELLVVIQPDVDTRRTAAAAASRRQHTATRRQQSAAAAAAREESRREAAEREFLAALYAPLAPVEQPPIAVPPPVAAALDDDNGSDYLGSIEFDPDNEGPPLDPIDFSDNDDDEAWDERLVSRAPRYSRFSSSTDDTDSDEEEAASREMFGFLFDEEVEDDHGGYAQRLPQDPPAAPASARGSRRRIPVVASRDDAAQIPAVPRQRGRQRPPPAPAPPAVPVDNASGSSARRTAPVVGAAAAAADTGFDPYAPRVITASQAERIGRLVGQGVAAMGLYRSEDPDKPARIERARAQHLVDNQADSLAKKYTRKCGVCWGLNPRKRVAMVECGHIACEPCADQIEDRRGSKVCCPFCRTMSSYIRLFEAEEGEEDAAEATAISSCTVAT